MAYRGAVLALVVGSVVALFLIINPPESESTSNSPRMLATTTPALLTTATPTRTGKAARTPTATQPASAQTPVTTPTVTTQRTHTVQAGDTLSGIAQLYNTTVDALISANPGTTENLQIGAVLRIPGP